MYRVCWSKRSNALDKASLLPVICTATDQQAIDSVLIEYADRLVRFGFSDLEETFG